MDAAQGLQFSGHGSEVHPDWKTISNVECACGCRTLLSQKTVDRGWTVIRGHKLAMAGVGRIAPVLGKPREYHTSKVVSNTSMDSIDKFIGAELQLVTDQLDTAIKDKVSIESLIKQLITKKDKLVRVRAAVKEL